MFKRNIFFFLFIGSLLAACSKDDLAFDVIESPVLAQFESLDDAGASMLKIKASFYDLDKSGILDHTIGIDSLPVTGLAIKVFVFESTLVGEYTTNGLGEIIFEEDFSSLQGASRLEWVGSFEDTPFRIYQNF